jgi:hypothetical protein
MPKHRTSGSRRTSSSETSSNNFILDSLRQGDRIQVFSAGTQINGIGTFISVQNGFLTWIDSSGNISTTSLDAISISRTTGTV